MIYEVEMDGAVRKIELARAPGGAWQIAVDGKAMAADVIAVDEHTFSILVAGRSLTVVWEQGEKTPAATAYTLAAAGRELLAQVRDPRRLLSQRRIEQEGRARIKAPMAGKVVRVLAQLDDTVEAGQGLIVLEAMKMQNEVRSPKSGRLIACPVHAGDTVATGQLLAEVE